MRHYPVAGLSVALALASPTLAVAAGHGQGKTAQSELGVGMALFVNGDFRGALTHFNSSLAEAHGSEETAQIHLLRGQCFMALADEPDARRAFELALDQDSEAHLDPNKSPPEMISLLADVRRSLHAEITLMGEGGSATLDGANLGPLPIHQQIAIGRHSLEVFTAGGKLDQKQDFLARARDSITLSFGGQGTPTPAPPATVAPPPPLAPPAVPIVTAPAAGSEVAAETEPKLDFFGHLGAMADPINRGMAFEAGAGIERGLLIGSVSGVWGTSGGVVARAGVASASLLGPLGAYACAEVPIFFASGAEVGLGAQAGLSWRISIVEPYVGASLQHFFALPSSSTPSTYFLVPVGVRVYLP